MKSKMIVKNRNIDIDYEKNKLSWLYYMPLLLISGFVPLIVYGKYVDITSTTQALYWTGQNQLLDFFSFWKSRWVISLTATSLIIYIFLFISKKLPFKNEYKYYIPLGIYAFFVILSTIFAIDVPTALNGFVDMYQGMWVLLSYVTITFLVINYVNSERDLKLFLYAFIFLIIVEGLLGVGQYFGFDIFNTKLGNYLIIPSGVKVDGGLNFNFGQHTIYGTLFNTNFVGSFAVLMLPMVVVNLMVSKTKKTKVISYIATILCLFTWIGCNSRAGYIGVILILLFTVLFCRKHLFKYWKISASFIIVAILLFIFSNSMSNGDLIRKIKNMNLIEAIKAIKYSKDDRYVNFEDITISGKQITFKTDKEDLIIKVENDKLYFFDEFNNLIDIIQDDELISLNNEKYNRYKIVLPDSFPGFIVNIEEPWKNRSISFFIDEEEIKVIGSGGRICDNNVARTVKLLDGLESLGSGRGYIWGRTIPLFSKYFLIGSGADNFPYAFPQDDFFAKVNMGWSANMIIDKPHNMYFQIAINTGVLSLFSLIVLWVLYTVSSIKLYWNMEIDCLDKYMGLACFLSVVGYLISGLFNDHIVSVSPLFWLILGLGISINSKLKKKGETNV